MQMWPCRNEITLNTGTFQFACYVYNLKIYFIIIRITSHNFLYLLKLMDIIISVNLKWLILCLVTREFRINYPFYQYIYTCTHIISFLLLILYAHIFNSTYYYWSQYFTILMYQFNEFYCTFASTIILFMKMFHFMFNY